MANAEWVHWLAVIGLAVIAASLVFFAWWALFHDRARGRRRCPRCWYDLAYTTGMTCSECGFTGRTEKDFAKTRRRKALAAPAILAVAMLGGYVIDRANTNGWMSYVPTGALIQLLPLADDADGFIGSELSQRMARRSASEEHWLAILRKAAKGDFRARPGEEAWANKYGELLDGGVLRGLLGADDPQHQREVQDLLMSLPPYVDLSIREPWPSDIAPILNVQVRTWWPRQMQMRIAATPRIDGMREIEPDTHVLLDRPIQVRSYSLPLPKMESGSHEVPIDLTVQMRAPGDEDWRVFNDRTAIVKITIEGKFEDTLAAVGGEEFDEAIRAALSAGLHKWPTGSLPVRVGIDQETTQIEAFDNTAVGVRVDVLRDGDLARQIDLWWRAGSRNVRRQTAWEVPMLDPEVLDRPDVEDEQWTMRVRSLPELALRVDGVKRYWQGEVTMPARLIPRQGDSGPRGWMPEGDAIVKPPDGDG